MLRAGRERPAGNIARRFLRKLKPSRRARRWGVAGTIATHRHAASGSKRSRCDRRDRLDRLTTKNAPAAGRGVFRFVDLSSRDQSIRGSVSNWWNGGGEDKVHSSVVAPSPHGLSSAFLPAISDQIRLMKKITMPAAMIM